MKTVPLLGTSLLSAHHGTPNSGATPPPPCSPALPIYSSICSPLLNLAPGTIDRAFMDLSIHSLSSESLFAFSPFKSRLPAYSTWGEMASNLEDETFRIEYVPSLHSLRKSSKSSRWYVIFQCFLSRLPSDSHSSLLSSTPSGFFFFHLPYRSIKLTTLSPHFLI